MGCGGEKGGEVERDAYTCKWYMQCQTQLSRPTSKLTHKPSPQHNLNLLNVYCPECAAGGYSHYLGG